MVTHTLTTFDGGKLMVGFGSVGGIIKAGWMIKMWGTNGDRNCAAAGTAVTITGYVTMVPGTSVDLIAAAGTSSDCNLTTNAKTQWTYSSFHNTLGLEYVVSTVEYEGTNSIVYLHAAEDIYCGNTGATCDTATFDDPLYIAGGGATGFTKWGGFGLGAYTIYFAVVDREGASDAGIGGANGWMGEAQGNTAHYNALGTTAAQHAIGSDTA